MNSEEMHCEAEDLVRGTGKAPGSATKRNPSTGLGATVREMRINDPTLIGVYLALQIHFSYIKPYMSPLNTYKPDHLAVDPRDFQYTTLVKFEHSCNGPLKAIFG